MSDSNEGKPVVSGNVNAGIIDGNVNDESVEGNIGREADGLIDIGLEMERARSYEEKLEAELRFELKEELEDGISVALNEGREPAIIFSYTNSVGQSENLNDVAPNVESSRVIVKEGSEVAEDITQSLDTHAAAINYLREAWPSRSTIRRTYFFTGLTALGAGVIGSFFGFEDASYNAYHDAAISDQVSEQRAELIDLQLQMRLQMDRIHEKFYGKLPRLLDIPVIPPAVDSKELSQILRDSVHLPIGCFYGDTRCEESDYNSLDRPQVFYKHTFRNGVGVVAVRQGGRIIIGKLLKGELVGVYASKSLGSNLSLEEVVEKATPDISLVVIDNRLTAVVGDVIITFENGEIIYKAERAKTEFKDGKISFGNMFDAYESHINDMLGDFAKLYGRGSNPE